MAMWDLASVPLKGPTGQGYWGQELTACCCFQQSLHGALYGVFLHLSSHSTMLSGHTGFANTLLSTALDICVPVMSTPIPSSLLMSFQCGIISHLFLGESASEQKG